MRSWSLSFFNYIWPFWTEMERKVWVLTEIRGDEEGVICSLCLISPSLLWNISPCVCSSLLLSSPSPPLLFFSHSLQTFFATLSYFLYPSLHPRLNPIPSHSHLSNSYPPLSISSPAPYPSYSTSVGMTDCWNWADSPPRRLQTIPYNRNYVTPPPIPSPSARIDYPTLQGDNQWAWPDFETWWVRACV